MNFKILLFALFVCISVCAQAQLTIVTNLREDGIYDTKKEEWSIISSTEGMTVFNFKHELTVFRHITNEMSSLYTIDEWVFDEDKVSYEMQVTSDANNNYDLIIDGSNKFIIFFYYDVDENFRMVRHTIRNIYIDDEDKKKE